MALAPAAPLVPSVPDRASLVVVSDDNYPPYIFRDAEGQLKGILPEQWALWSHKTGIKVDLRAMDWSAAQELMRQGQADVIDTIFRTPERERLYDFTPPYAEIKVPVYVHRNLGGIADVSSLRGFTIGVKSGDAVVSYLATQGISDLKLYPSYEAIVLAAKAREIKIFSVDQPAAIYFMYKHGLEEQFREALVLYTGQFHRAVQKNRSGTLKLVQAGFQKITPGEYRAIADKWIGVPFSWSSILRKFILVILLVLAVVVLLAAGNLVLRHRIHVRTAELRRALGELQQSQTYFEQVFNSINDGLFVHDAATGRILDVNQRTCEMLGYTRDELLNLDVDRLSDGTPPYDGATARERMQRARTGTPQIMEWKSRHRDGHVFWTEVNIRNVQIGADERLIVSVRDIADRRQTEDERLRYERRLQQSQRLESLGLLAGGIAHDFNNLLMAIIGNIDLALQKIPANSAVGDELKEAARAAKRTADLVQQMLAYSGKGHFHVKPLQLDTAIRETMPMLQGSVLRNAQVQIAGPATLPAILADETQIHQVIMNLVINAAEAMEGRPGKLSVIAETLEASADKPIRVWPHDVLPPGRYVYLEVTDRGAGIEPGLLDKIFDPFFSTKFMGRGLGLAAVLGIVRGHNGAIQVESQLGRGTTFRVFFPVHEASNAPQAASSPAEEPTERITWNGETVLVVDDEATVRETATKLLKHLGLHVICAESGEAALHLYQEQAGRVRAIILDLTMPGLDGTETYTALRQLDPAVPVIISSGYAEEDVLLRFEGVGPKVFIQKPYTLKNLRAVVTRILPPAPRAS